MPKLLIIADVRGWAYDKRAQVLKKYAPDDFDVDITYVHEVPKDLSAYDLVYNIDYSFTDHIRQRLRNQSAKAILVNSHNADHQRAHEQAKNSFAKADYVIFNNKKAWEHFGRRERTCNISNGVDLDFFSYGQPLDEVSRRKMKVIWVGPAGKGLHDILEPLQQARKDITFEFKVKTGKEWDPVTHLPDPEMVWNNEQMRDWYRSARFVICCSETDATPNYLLEAMACGCVPVTTRVGNALEFPSSLPFVFVDRTVDAFSRGLDQAVVSEQTRRRAGKMAIEQWHWKDRAAMFFDLFRMILEGDIPKPFSYTDGNI